MAYCRNCGIKTVAQKSLVLEMEEKCELGHNLEFKHHGAPAYDKDGCFECDECGDEFPYTIAFWRCLDIGCKNNPTRELCGDCGCDNDDDKREMATYYKDRMHLNAHKANDEMFAGGSMERAQAAGVAMGVQDGQYSTMGAQAVGM